MRTFTDKVITRQLPMKRLSEANKRKMLKQAQQAEYSGKVKEMPNMLEG